MNKHILRHWSLYVLPLLLLGSGLLSCWPELLTAQEAAPPVQVSIPSIESSNTQELRGRVGQTVVVIGEVGRVGKSAGGNRFINFAGTSVVTVFIHAQDVKRFTPSLPEELYPPGRTIAVSGKLERYRDQLQIRATQPGQIGLGEMKSAPPPLETSLPEPVELKSIGRDAWESPAGLKYSGRDPEGLTRREHVLRHARDIPDRDGPHGVFDGGESHAFAWIDLAWQKIKTQDLRPDPENGRDAYTVNMERRVGYLGGETGARKRHPPLERIFIVVRKGTTEVITAFPK